MNETSPNTCVWFEIPVTDLARAKAFYGAVVQGELTDNNDGPNPMSMFPMSSQSAVSGHLYPGKPAPSGSGNTVHIAVPGRVEDAMRRVTAAGGQVLSPVIEIPAGRFAYCLDPDGNSIGVFGA